MDIDSVETFFRELRENNQKEICVVIDTCSFIRHHEGIVTL